MIEDPRVNLELIERGKYQLLLVGTVAALAAAAAAGSTLTAVTSLRVVGEQEQNVTMLKEAR